MTRTETMPVVTSASREWKDISGFPDAGGRYGLKRAVPRNVTDRVIVQNNPIESIDPWGSRSFPFGAGWLCVNNNCNSPCNIDNSPIAYYYPEDDPETGEKAWLPVPKAGGCVAADAVAGPSGTIKIPDNCTCKIVCSDDGTPKHLSCWCWRIPWKLPGPPDPKWPPSPYAK